MPMYYPDLKSVRNCAISMSKNKGDKQYKGNIPERESDLYFARKDLGNYFRDIWNDNIAAAEVEFAATKENYDNVIALSILNILKRDRK